MIASRYPTILPSSTMGPLSSLEVVFGFVPYTAFLELTSRPKAELPGKEYVDL
jgi:hypothetical protein